MAKARTTAQQMLTVQRRTAMGTRPTRRLRHSQAVPGIVYGRGMEPLAITVKARDLAKLLHSKRGEHALVTLRLEEDGSWEKPVLVKTVQHDPVDGQVRHVDFHAIVLTQRLRVRVPVVLKGEPVGVKQEGGILEQFLREVEVECLPTEIPAAIEFEVGALKIGDTVHLRDLTLPTHVTMTSDPAGAVASVQEPKEEKPEEAEAAPTEPEVIREKKEEGEAAPGETEKPEASARPGSSESRAGETKAKPEK